MAITFNPSSLIMRVGFKQTVVVTSTTPITSIAAVDARIITVSGATGSTTASVVITPVNGSYGVGKLRIGNSGGELVDLNITVLGIDTTFVAGMIGIASSDIGTLCRGLAGTVQKINKWSKWKSIKYAGVAPITAAIIEAEKCGFTINSTLFSTFGAGLIDWSDNTTGQYIWVYNPPTGGASSPYRIDDFRSYQQASLPMFKMPVADETGSLYVSQPYPGLSLYKEYDLAQSQVEGGIIPADIKITSSAYLSSYYLGIMVIDLAIYGTIQNVERSIVLIKTAATSCATVKKVKPNFLPIPSNDALGIAFFLSPRVHDIIYPEGGGSIPQYSDYVWLDSCFYNLVLYNESAETTLWQFDKSASNYDTIAESNTNSGFYLAESTDFPTNNSTYGIWFATGDFFTLYPDHYTMNHSNSYAMKIIIQIIGEAGGDAAWRNLCTYSTAYDELTGLPSAWNMIYCKNNAGKFCIGHGYPNDAEPTYETETYDYEDVTKIEIRNYYYPSGTINTMYVHVRIHTTDPDTPATIYSFSVSGERMSTPVYLRFGTYGSYEAPQYMKFTYLSVVSTPNTV